MNGESDVDIDFSDTDEESDGWKQVLHFDDVSIVRNVHCGLE